MQEKECYEIRAYQPMLAEADANADKNADEGIIEGIPIVYDKPTIIAGVYEEVILPTAVQDSAIDRNTFLTYNHLSDKKPLARVKNGSLSFDNLSDGLHMQAKLNLQRTDAKDLYLAISDGCIDKMSFCFVVGDDEWDFDGEMPKRTIKSISYIKEVSAVDEPAYDDTSIQVVQRAQEQVDAALKVVEMAKNSDSAISEVEAREEAQLQDTEGMQEANALALAKAKAKAKLRLEE
jgi:hypothetical protein